MSKIALAVVAAALTLGLAGCDYFNSPEKKAFDEFLAKCKANPELAACKEWEASKNSVD